jgi:hypothetical protein
MLTTTCQICSRQIKASKGLIAHHGYERPGMGFQTTSCFGARRLPYEDEQGFDAILDGIKNNREYAAHIRAFADRHVAGEGEVLVFKTYNRSGSTKWMTLETYYKITSPGRDRAIRIAEAIANYGTAYRARYAQYLRAGADAAEAVIPALQARHDNHPTNAK